RQYVGGTRPRGTRPEAGPERVSVSRRGALVSEQRHSGSRAGSRASEDRADVVSAERGSEELQERLRDRGAVPGRARKGRAQGESALRDERRGRSAVNRPEQRRPLLS